MRVPVTPQNRAAFHVFPNTNGFAGGELRNRIRASPPTSTGAALLGIEQDEPGVPA